MHCIICDKKQCIDDDFQGTVDSRLLVIRTKKGLNIPINGKPSEVVEKGKPVRSVAITGPDYIDMKPTMFVKEGETVQTGQKLFECKKNPGLIFTSPAAGKITAIKRGVRRVFQTIEIQVTGSNHVEFSHFNKRDPSSYSRDQVKDLLIESGMWTSIRQRPFNKAPSIDATPHSLFVSTIDTNPLCLPPKLVISQRLEEFQKGLQVLSTLPEKKLYLCTDGEGFPLPDLNKLKTVSFSGLHPAGNVGTHIHFLEPVSLSKSVWHVGYQDVIAIGHLFLRGKLDLERWVALGGPRAKNPRILKTRIGANLSDLLQNEIKNPENTRVISGSILQGRTQDETFQYLGRFDNQISCIEEDHSRELLGWHTPGFNRFSQKNIYVSKLFPGRKFSLGSSTHGSPRAMVPTGSFEEVTPLDILPTQLLRSLLSYDTDQAQELGCLDLAEEDLALYTFVSPGKIDFGPVLRENLSKIEKEG